MKNFTKCYPLLILIVFIEISAMSFNPIDKGSETEKTFVSTGLSNFKNHLENLKEDVHLFKEDKISVEELHLLYNSFYVSITKNSLSKGNNKTLALRIELIRIYTLGLTGFASSVH